MLTQEMNDRLTQIGPGTPMGNLLRRYWHPVASLSWLNKRAAIKVRILGEDLALWRDRSGNLGLTAELCPHRRCSLAFGIPEPEGIRCPYHGWLYDTKGNCIEQPGESPNSTFKNRIKTPAYRTEVLGGLIWGYMGPEPAPLLPRWEYLVSENTHRSCGYVDLPVNWLAPMENSMDPVHLEWLHVYWGNYLRDEYGFSKASLGQPHRRHKKIGFDVFEYGLIKRRIYEGGSEDDPEWREGHPLVFPNWLFVGHPQIRVPLDDGMTRIWYYHDQRFPDTVKVPEQEQIPVYEFKLFDEDGDFIVSTVEGQDLAAWYTQGLIADRTEEHVGASDRGILLYRKLLQEEMLKVEAGQDPMGVIRDPEKNVCIKLPDEYEYHWKAPTTYAEAERAIRLFGEAAAPQELKDELLNLMLAAYHISAA